MKEIGLIECLKEYNGQLTPTFKNSGDSKTLHQIDHLFVTVNLYEKMIKCYVGDKSLIFENQLSDHLPIIADFNINE
jgi:exonuclease III